MNKALKLLRSIAGWILFFALAWLGSQIGKELLT